MSSATQVSTSLNGPVRDVDWYRQLWWKTGNIHPKAKWEEATYRCEAEADYRGEWRKRKRYFYKDVSQSPVNSNDTPDAPSSDITNNTLNSDVCRETKTQCTTSPIRAKTKSSEDSRNEEAIASKVIDDFPDEEHKKRVVSDEIRQREHEEKLQEESKTCRKTSSAIHYL
ncbi:18790_t:CDS:2, partial [Acaulospora morrowiae]